MLPLVGSGHKPEAAPVVGAYVWGGLIGSVPSLDAFHQSIAFLLEHKYTAVRFTVTPASLQGYGVPQTDCRVDRRSPCYLREFLDAPAFHDPRLQLVMITLHDFVSDHHILDPDFLEAHHASIAEEYADDLNILLETFRGRRVRVLLSNWEGDNMVYCGSMFQFTNNAQAAQSCAASVNGDFSRALGRFAAWIAIRDGAIADFRKEHPELNVEQAPEFNNLNLFDAASCHTTCRPELTVFETLRAASTNAGKRRALCSYSAYDSLNRKRLDPDLDRIATACDSVILGELGIGLKGTDLADLKDRYKVIASAIEKHGSFVTALMLWHAFETPSPDPSELQLYEQDGSPANVRALPALLRPRE